MLAYPLKQKQREIFFFLKNKREKARKTQIMLKKEYIHTSIVLKDLHQECLQCEKNKQMSAEALNKMGKFVDCRQHFTHKKRHINEVDRMCIQGFFRFFYFYIDH